MSESDDNVKKENEREKSFNLIAKELLSKKVFGDNNQKNLERFGIAKEEQNYRTAIIVRLLEKAVTQIDIQSIKALKELVDGEKTFDEVIASTSSRKGKVVRPIKKTPTDEELAEALENSGGVQMNAVKYLRDNFGYIYSQQAISKRMQKNPELRESAGIGVEKMTDFVETKLFEAIEEGKLPAIFFYLKCKGKKRGYVEKVIVNGDMNLNVKENSAIHLSDEDLQKAVDALLEKDGMNE